MQIGNALPTTAAQNTKVLSKVAESRLDPTHGLRPEEVAGFQKYYNGMLGNLDNLKIPSEKLEQLLPPSADDLEVEQATEPQPDDDAETRQLRGEYQSAYHEVRRETTRAVRHLRRLGEGEHQLAGGETVNIARDSDQTRVTTRRSDGGQRGATLKGHQAKVTVQRPGEDAYTLEKDGAAVTRKGDRGDQKFQVKNGKPVKEETYPMPTEMDVEVRLSGRILYIPVRISRLGQFGEGKQQSDTYRLNFSIYDGIKDDYSCSLILSLDKGIKYPRLAVNSAVNQHVRATLQHGPTDQLPRGYVVHPGPDEHKVRSEPGLPPGAYNPDPNEFYTRHKHRP